MRIGQILQAYDRQEPKGKVSFKLLIKLISKSGITKVFNTQMEYTLLCCSTGHFHDLSFVMMQSLSGCHVFARAKDGNNNNINHA